jgi:hypothetical protein
MYSLKNKGFIKINIMNRMKHVRDNSQPNIGDKNKNNIAMIPQTILVWQNNSASFRKDILLLP